MLKVMSTIKSVFIYVLSVALAFMAGCSVTCGGVIKALREEPTRKRISYADYRFKER